MMIIMMFMIIPRIKNADNSRDSLFSTFFLLGVFDVNVKALSWSLKLLVVSEIVIASADAEIGSSSRPISIKLINARNKFFCL